MAAIACHHTMVRNPIPGSKRKSKTIMNVQMQTKTRHRAAPEQPTIMDRDILVFGSDLGGRHISGDALRALRDYGAAYGRAVGLSGRSYAIPVRDERGRPLPVAAVSRYVQAFLRFAATHKELTFRVTRLGCGPHDPRDDQLAPLFGQAPINCRLPKAWLRYLKR